MKRYSPDRDGAMDEYEDGDYVRVQDAAALQRQLNAVTRDQAELQTKLDGAARLVESAQAAAHEAQRQLVNITAECADWKSAHDSMRAVYRDIGANLGAKMPAELVNEVARRRMRQLQIAREALQSIAKSYPETDEGEVLAGIARDALKELLK